MAPHMGWIQKEAALGSRRSSCVWRPNQDHLPSQARHNSDVSIQTRTDWLMTIFLSSLAVYVNCYRFSCFSSTLLVPAPTPSRLFSSHSWLSVHSHNKYRHSKENLVELRKVPVLPIVKLKPSMLKVALRHFLNPCFFGAGSVIVHVSALWQRAEDKDRNALPGETWCTLL